MGYAAVVKCNCYRDGKAAPPPHAAYVQADEEGPYLALDDLGLDEATRLAWHLEFDRWREHACMHPDMDYAYEHLQNMSGMATFRATLARLEDPKRFPVLSQHLPVANGGTLPAEYATAALREIQGLEQEPTPESMVQLTEVTSGQLIASVEANNRCVFVFSSRSPNYALDADGFLLFLDRKRTFLAPRSQVVFRSMHFKQTRLGPEAYQFTDLATGCTYQAPLGLPIETPEAEEYTFTVATRPIRVGTRHGYILQALRNVLAASVETGNPIIWH